MCVKKAIIIFMLILPMILAGCNNTINKSNENNQKEPIAIKNNDKDSIYVSEQNNTSNETNKSDSDMIAHKNNDLEANLADTNAMNNNDNPFIGLCIADTLNQRDIDKVYDAYSALQETHSEADMDDLAIYIGECYQDATNKLIKNNKELEKNINDLRTHLNNIISDVTSIEYGINGGGTMYVHNANRRLGWKEFRLYWYSKDILNHSKENKNRYDDAIVDIQNSLKQIDKIDVNELNDYFDGEQLTTMKNGVITSSDQLKNEINSIINILNNKNDANSELLELIKSYITLQ